MEVLLKHLLDELESIGDSNEELYDSAVREKMRAFIHYRFLLADDSANFTDDLGCYSHEVNRRVFEALQRFVVAAEQFASQRRWSFIERLRGFQNDDVQSVNERSDYEDFFGHVPQERFDRDGNYLA